MKLLVKRYNAEQDYHECITPDGNLHRVDIMVDGGLENKDREFWVGKTIECEYLNPYIEIANSVKEG